MKKIMALCLSLLMALSMVSFSVMAEEIAVDFAEIANSQPAKFVTDDLDLGSHTITSSNEAIIALDGDVTRPIYEDATVALTIDGGAPFDVVVKAKTVDVLYANDFSVDKGEGVVLASVEGNEPCEVRDGVLKSIIGDTTNGRTWIYFYPTATESTMPLTVEFDTSNITDVKSAGVDLRISGERYDAEGNKIGSFSTVSVARCDSVNGFHGYSSWGSNASKKSVAIKYNPATGEYWLNGTLSSKNLKTCTDVGFNYSLGKYADDCEKVVITMFAITNAAGGCMATFDMDNLVYYQEVSQEDAFLSATPEEMLANYSHYLSEEYVTDGGSFAALGNNLKFTADEELPAGVSLSWETSDADVIAEDGTIKRDIENEKTAAITGTLSVDGAEDMVKTYDVTVLPLSLSGRSELVDFDSYDLDDGAAIAELGWTGPSSEKLSFTNVVDGDNSYATVDLTDATLFSENVLSYTFKNAPKANGRYYVLEYDYRTNTAITGGVTGLAFVINDKESAKIQNRSGNYGLHPYRWRENDVWFGESSGTVKINATDFVTLKTVIDTKENTISYYADGVLKYSEARYGGADLTNITSAKLQLNARQAAGSFSIDNIRLYCENDLTEVITTLPAEEKVALFKGFVEKSSIGEVNAIGDELDLDSGYANYDLDTVGVSIAWESSAPEYISNDGEVVKTAHFLSDEEITMTATIASGAESDTVSFTMPAPDGTELVNSSDFSDTTVSAGKATYVDDEDAEHGKVLHIATAEVGKHTSSDNIGIISYGDWKGRAVVSADVKFINGNDAASGGIVIKTIAAYNGISVMFNFRTNKVSVTTTVPEVEADASKLKANSAKTIYMQMDPELIEKEGQWINVAVDFNALSQTFVLYVDGKLYTELPMLQSNMKTVKNGGGAVRGISLECSNKGELWVDNVSIRKFTNSTESEVNAALNAALIDFGSSYIKPVLTNCTLPSMTIGRSWNIAADAFNRDVEEDGTIKPSNVSTYKYVTDGPEISWNINGTDATEINVSNPQVVEITVTATKDGITESKTFRRRVAPASIRGLAASTAALNGLWLEDVNAETDKVVIAQYNGKKLVSTKIISLKDNENYIAETGILKLTGFIAPSKNADVDALKVFVIGDKGISPITFKNAELNG